MRSDFSQRISARPIGTRLAGLLIVCAAALLCAPWLVSQADNYETLDQSFEFKTGGTVKIDSGMGEVHIEVWAEELVHVTAKKIEPAGHPVAISDMAFFNTKSQLTIKSQPADTNSRIDITVYVPRNTNLRINTNGGGVSIRGAVSSAMVETKTGNIKLEAPPSLDADLVLSTVNGVVKAALPIEAYGTPTPKALQGKLGSGGNPVILRSTAGNIQIAALERELDQDVATIPSGPPPSSSSDQNSYGNYGGYGNNNDDSLFGNQNNTQRPRNNSNNQPYTYGGSYGGNPNNRPNNNNNGNNGNNSNRGGNVDIFNGGRNTDDSGTATDLSNPGVLRRNGNENIDSQGSIGVKIIPPPGARPNNQDDSNYDQNNNQPAQPPPLKPRNNNNRNGNNLNRPPNSQNNQSNQSNQNNSNNSDDNKVNQNRGNNDQAANRPIDNGSLYDRNNSNGTINPDKPTVRRNTNPNLQDSRAQNNRPQQANDDGNDDGTIKIDTKLVNLNVSVLDRGGRSVTNLKKEDFQIYEDGVMQSLDHFESVNSPFNLVLVIDLSGSIIDKIDILRRAALRFIDVTKPADKIAVVTFTRSVQVVSELTSDRQQLRQRLQYMHMPRGGTAFYEALWFTVDQIIKPVENERNAIVLISDGVDNSISVTYPIPSRVTFEQVLRKVQESGALLFPIYLDTETENVSQEIEAPESYVLARKQLGALAEASGGVMFKAERPENLEGVYEKVAADLRTLYSIAYYPTNASRDGSWRKLRVKVDKNDVAVRTRRGYYAK